MDEVLYSGDYIKVLLKDGWYEYVHDRTGELVGILVFSRDGSGGIDRVLGRYEYDVQTGTKKLTSITGGVEPNQTPIECAVQELYEEAGFSIEPEELIDLGTMTLSKSDDSILYLYGFDCTSKEGSRREESISDGTIGEEDAYCDWVGFLDCVDMQNPVNHVAILRIFQKELFGGWVL